MTDNTALLPSDEGGVKHTPGPWRLEPSKVSNSLCVYSGEGWDSYGIGEAWNLNDRPENTANAHLIAAAPEMFEALKAAEDALSQFASFESDARHIMGNTNFEIVLRRRDQVRAALAKAEPR